MKRFLALFLILLVFLVAGCVEDSSNQNEETNYVCPDGSVVSDPSDCSLENETTTTSETTTSIEEETYPLEVLNATKRVENNYFYISGVVKNLESFSSIYTKVVVKFYESEEVIEVSHEDLGTLGSEDSKDFEMRFSKFEYDYYTIKASGEYSGENIYSGEKKFTE